MAEWGKRADYGQNKTREVRGMKQLLETKQSSGTFLREGRGSSIGYHAKDRASSAVELYSDVEAAENALKINQNQKRSQLGESVKKDRKYPAPAFRERNKMKSNSERRQVESGSVNKGRVVAVVAPKNSAGAHDKSKTKDRKGELIKDSKSDISYRTLLSWSETKNSDDLLLKMTSNIESMENIVMSNSLPGEWYTLLLQAFTKIMTCQIYSIKQKKVLQILSTSKFLTHLLTHYLDSKQQQGMMWTEAANFFNSILGIIQHIVKLLPERAHNCKPVLLYLQEELKCVKPVRANHKLHDLVASTISTVTDTQNTWAKRQRPIRFYGPSADSETPPDDFRELSVIPTASDLSTDANPFVRAIVTKGTYRDQEHYLDILFRLMREDFIRPLRNGINEYRENGQDKHFRSSDIRLYHDVHFTGMTHINGINHVIQFDVSNMKHIKWDHSKRLINGNLLCLSNDNFQSNVIFATVSFRDTKMLKKGIVSISCLSELNTVLKTTSNDSFVMAETMAYYEAVHPILKGLQTIDSDLPLKDYIILCQKQIKPPKYLLQGVFKYDIACLMKTPMKREVKVLNTLNWPITENMCLNPCQRKAAILALTKEVALIQGPPGTGKTYVGLKVMEVLLKNKDSILPNGNCKNDPILVICYTNHALDQFLEGIMDFCPKGIVRVGGKSSSQRLEPCNLNNLKKKQRLMSWAWKMDIGELKDRMKSYSNRIEDMKEKLDSLSTDVESESVLCNYMSRKHHDSLISKLNVKGKKSRIHQWLNAPNESLLDSLPGMIITHMNKLVMKCIGLMQKRGHIALGKHPTIVDRVQHYSQWLSEYQYCLRTDIEESKVSNQHVTYALLSDFRASQRSSILHDSELRGVISPDFIAYVIKHLEENEGHIPDEDRIIECWVLGTHNNLSKQLDEVEILTRFIQKGYSSEENDVDEFDDKEESRNVIRQRQIFLDEGHETKCFNATLRVTKEGAFLLNRARSLGISESSEEGQDQADYHDDVVQDHDGFQIVTHRKPLTFSKIERYLSNDKLYPMCQEEEEDLIQDVWELNMQKRYTLYKLWITRYKECLVKEMQSLIKEYNGKKEELAETRMNEDVCVLKKAKVIGMTTTGAAKKKAWLEAVGCRIIVVEEAAEVLEAHIVTALNENCQHLILIGDHKQLRPNPTVYEHAKNFALDVSLFERLVDNGIPHVTLREQHRMRESISVIMRHIYPNLQDHISVKGYENIRGVTKNIFFIQHEHKEESVKDTLSKSNPYEAEYLTQLCKYFLLQGYEASQITVLATYAGQVLTLKKEMKEQNLSQEIRVTSVDNFQGEENDIILLSLVRSNDNSNVGYLKVDNRVCVALSRAKKGLFAIGNLSLLATQSKLWEKIKETAETEKITGDGLPVACRNHPDENDVMRVPKDFDRRPQGGCAKKCNFRMKCGHTCRLTCHGYDLEHKDIKCNASCPKMCPEGHPCPQKCWEYCRPCEVPVDKEIATCGHTNKFPCGKSPEETDCYSLCESVLECGHRCSGKCGKCKLNDGIHKWCNIPMTYTWPCSHVVEVPCYLKPSKYPCPKPCDEVLQCGHTCPGTCSDCLEGAIHLACKEKCQNMLLCGHVCQSNCGIPCPPCSRPCPAMCRHSSCDQINETCGESCIPCYEPCVNTCYHRKCTRPCNEVCNVLPCQRRCLKLIRKCGHSCSGLCGELCVCQECERFVRIKGTINETLCTPNIEQERKSTLLLKLPSCMHIFRLDELDGYIQSVYERFPTRFICCPKCSTPIQKCNRYERTLKENSQKRNELKENKNAMSLGQEKNFKKSLELLQKIDIHRFWSPFAYLPHDDDSKLKIKFAYVLSVLLSLSQKYSIASSNDNKVKKMVPALSKVDKKLNSKQREEYKIELRRLLICSYASVLTAMADQHKVILSDVSTNSWNDIRDEMAKVKPDSALLQLGYDIVETLEKDFERQCRVLGIQNVIQNKKKMARTAFDALATNDAVALCEAISKDEYPQYL